MTRRAGGLFALAVALVAAGCRSPAAPAPAPPTPTAAPAPASPTATVSPLRVEGSPAPSIYDRTPGVLHEESGRPRSRTPGASRPAPSLTPSPGRS